MLETMGRLVCSRGIPINGISSPKWADSLLHLLRAALAWYTIGMYHSATSAFVEPYHHHKASNHSVISKLMCHFYLQHPPSHEHLLYLLGSWATASCLTRFKLAWKTTTLLVLPMAKHFSDLTSLYIDNQCLFLQCHAAIFVPTSGGKTDSPGHLSTPVLTESHSNVNLCPVLYLKTYLWHT